MSGNYMSHTIIWKFCKACLFVIILMAIIGILLTGKFIVGILAIACSIILLFGGFISWKSKSLAGYIYTLYTMIVGPLNFVIAMISPSTLKVEHLNKFYDVWLFDNINIMLKYALFLVLFYIVSMMTIVMFQNFWIKSIFSIKLPKILVIRRPLYIALFMSTIEYYVRISFKLNIPGYEPLIPFTGVLVYLFQAIDYYLLFLILASNVSIDGKMSSRNIINCLLGMIFTQLSSILIGQRGVIMYALALLIIYIIIVQFDLSNLQNFSKTRKRTIRILVLCILITLISVGVTNQVRIGEFRTIGFIMERITGLYDGSIVLHYFLDSNNNPPMAIMDFFNTLITGKGTIPNKYYTNQIQGYPVTTVHSNAAPVFITSWFYSGIIGIILLSIYCALLMSLFERVLKRNIVGYLKTYKTRYKAGVYCSIYALLIALGSNLIDGNITAWKMYIVPIACYYLIRITKDISTLKRPGAKSNAISG